MYKSLTKIFLVTLTALWLAGPGLASPSSELVKEKAKTTPGYSFKQFSANYGNVVCYVTRDNFRMDALDVKMFVRRPFKTIILYNLESKLYFPMSVDGFASRLTIRSLSSKDKQSGWKEHTDRAKDEDRKICGFQCNSYLSWQINPKGIAQKRVQFWTTKDLDLPKEMADACARLTDCPAGIGFPFKINQFETQTYIRSAKKYTYVQRPLLDTRTMTKMPVPDQMFVTPTGFRKARDEVEVIMGSDPN